MGLARGLRVVGGSGILVEKRRSQTLCQVLNLQCPVDAITPKDKVLVFRC